MSKISYTNNGLKTKNGSHWIECLWKNEMVGITEMSGKIDIDI